MIAFLLVIGVLAWLFAAFSWAASIVSSMGGLQSIAAAVYGTMGVVAFLGCAILQRQNKHLELHLTQQSITDGKGKSCPDCAEVVMPKALKCRYCGHQFHRIDKPQVEQTRPAASSTEPDQ